MKYMTAITILCLSFSGALIAATGDVSTSEGIEWLHDYNLLWTSPSTRALDSMPIGGGNIALNVWSNGKEVLFYIGSSDSWAEAKDQYPPQQVKLGRVRLTVTPNPFARDFSQELDLATNSIRLRGTTEGGISVSVHIWVDNLKPVVHVEGESSQPITTTVAVESWRGDGRFHGTSAQWHYRNDGPSQGRLKAIAFQNISEIASVIPDPIGNLTFGGRISGEGFGVDGTGEGVHEGQPFKCWRMKTISPASRFAILAALRIEQDPTLEVWQEAVEQLEAESRSTVVQDRDRTEQWWQAFWDRSHILINPDQVGE